MPRQLRLEYPGAVYHVVKRGDRREEIFRDDSDCERSLSTLTEACGKTQWQVQGSDWVDGAGVGRCAKRG